MRKVRRTPTESSKLKKITVKRLLKKTTFVIQYADGRRIETNYIEIQGASTISIDPTTKDSVIRTEANINLGQSVGACAVCGGDADDQHAHA